MNVIVPPGSPSIPFGQAVISTLLFKCYKQAHKLLTHEKPTEPPSKMLQLIDSLLALLCALEQGHTFDPIVLRLIAEDVHEIEVSKVNGVYLEKDGSVAMNQVQISRDLRLAHELIHECMHFIEHSPLGLSKDTAHPEHEKITKLMDQVQEVKDELQVKIQEGGSMGALDFKPLMEPVKKALMYLEEGLETSVGAASYALSNLLNSTLRLASVALDNVVDPLNENLQPTYDRIQAVYDRLISIRNQHNWEKLVAPAGQQAPPIMKKYGDELQKCDLELQEISKSRIDGLWVDRKDMDSVYMDGQDFLDHSYNRANALLRDLLFRR